jgi:hypothetical protein
LHSEGESTADLRFTAGHEHDFAYHASFSQQLVRVPCIRERKALCDHWLDPSFFEETEQGGHIFPEKSGFQPFKRLNTVGDDPFVPWGQPGAKDI